MDDAGASARLLLVEDESIIALSEKHMLKNAGYSVEIAKTGESAIAALEAGRVPDLILMDVDLGPGLDGPETASRILARWLLPIMFLSSHATEEMVGKVRATARYGYIVKDSGDAIITTAIGMALELFAKERILERRKLLLERAEETAKLGYWFVEPGSSRISLSKGSREILGIAAETCSFEDFGRLVRPDATERRALAFRKLIEDGEPYDQSYALRRPDTGETIMLRSSARALDGAVSGVLQEMKEPRS
jgi:FOG: CheY-like receiver